MEVLKWIGYLIISALGLCAAVAVAAFLAAVGASIGMLALGGFVVVLIAVGIEEYFNPSQPPDKGV